MSDPHGLHNHLVALNWRQPVDAVVVGKTLLIFGDDAFCLRLAELF